MTKAELIEAIARSTHQPKKVVATTLDLGVRPYRALDSQGQALLGARLRHFLRPQAPDACRFQSTHERADDHPGGAHGRLSRCAAAKEGALTGAPGANESDPSLDRPRHSESVRENDRAPRAVRWLCASANYQVKNDGRSES